MTKYQRLRLNASVLGIAILWSTAFNAIADDLAEANKLFKQTQYSQAIDKVNEILAKKPKDAQARFLKGLVLTEQNKADEAIKIFSTLTNDYPELPEPYNNLAVLYANQGQYEKARLALEMAIRTHPSYATAHENLGDIYAKMASQAYDRALKLDHGNSATQTKLAMIQDLFGDTSRKPGRIEVAASTPSIVVKSPAATIQPAIVKQAAAEPSANGDQSKDVLKTVQDWAAAWSAKNTSKYLAHYAADFKAPKGASRADWEAERKERISKPKSIRVVINHPTVTFSDSDHATVEFHQSYAAGQFKTTGSKTLLMAKSGAKWVIQEERVK
ncbi:MAG: tetratricopeptide repeat protein [Gallionella sp.]|nr:tetratricopeptide repeat protein [Gallionella sp.]